MQVVSQFVACLTTVHMGFFICILRYLQGTSTQGLLISSNQNLTLYGFSDTDWAGIVNDRQSTIGFSIFLGSSLISWKCKKREVVFKPSIEAENRAIVEIIWLRWLP